MAVIPPTRNELESRLADLLGIGIVDDDRDYVAEILDSLLDMADNPDDVFEYLGGFVSSSSSSAAAPAGDDDDDTSNDELRRFSLDVAKFRSDASVVTPASAAAQWGGDDHGIDDGTRTKTRVVLDEGAYERKAIKRREVETRESRQRKEREDLSRRTRHEEDEELLRPATTLASTASTRDGRTVSRRGKQMNGNDRDVDARPQVAESVTEESSRGGAVQDRATSMISERQPGGGDEARKLRRPERGTPVGDVCGCYGNMHVALANCLNCGRIVCEEEGANDYCHFCGYFVDGLSPVPPVDGTTGDDANDAKLASAIRHKERLLEYDRTSASRTTIHDDQEDYFTASTSMWSTDQEREENRALEESRRRDMHERKGHVLRIKF
ncbi:hypothetical protein ACHAXA_011039 [Cyclostephanos tholiformis]|uniref:TRIP4/RQT4 C2HC5-type zinc finger domain-containing protein n=1 Tax=Cyclostephanos tholiformis TaxID=382380 RepID=A0ABD3RYV9_9STRA